MKKFYWMAGLVTLLVTGAEAEYCIQIASAPSMEERNLVRMANEPVLQGLPMLRVERRGAYETLRAGLYPSYSQAVRDLGIARRVRSDAFVRTCSYDPRTIVYQIGGSPENYSPAPSREERYAAPPPVTHHRIAREPLQYELDRDVPPPTMRAHRPARNLDEEIPPPASMERRRPRRGGIPAPELEEEFEESYPSPIQRLQYGRDDDRLWQKCQECFAAEKRGDLKAPARERSAYPRSAPRQQEEVPFDRLLQSEKGDIAASQSKEAGKPAPSRIREEQENFWLKEMKKELQ